MFCGAETTRSQSLVPFSGFGSGWCENFLFFEELFNSTMNALHLVGNPAFCRPLDIQCLSCQGMRYHFVLALAAATGAEEPLRLQRPPRVPTGERRCRVPTFRLHSASLLTSGANRAPELWEISCPAGD